MSSSMIWFERQHSAFRLFQESFAQTPSLLRWLLDGHLPKIVTKVRDSHEVVRQKKNIMPGHRPDLKVMMTLSSKVTVSEFSTRSKQSSQSSGNGGSRCSSDHVYHTCRGQDDGSSTNSPKSSLSRLKIWFYRICCARHV